MEVFYGSVMSGNTKTNETSHQVSFHVRFVGMPLTINNHKQKGERMQRYWDLSNKERSELTREQVEAMLTVELMEKGVIKVEPPILAPIEEPAPPTTTLFCVKAGYHDPGFGYWEAKDAAEAAAKAVALDYDYIGGTHYNKIAKTKEVEIVPLQVYTPEELSLNRAVIERNNAAKAVNTKAEEEYRTACKAVEDACSGVWEDWYAQCETASRYERIIKIYNEYVKTCNGDEDIAFKFLRKAYLDPDICEAFEWSGRCNPFSKVEALA